MRYIRGFREGAAAAALAKLLAAEVDPKREYHLMEFCGGHTHAIFRYGVEDLLPDNVRLVHGPGCPVCVLAVPRLDAAIALSRRPDVILVSYGDMLRVPASHRRSLLKARAQGRGCPHGLFGARGVDRLPPLIPSDKSCSSPSVSRRRHLRPRTSFSKHSASN